jgi:hypothetical protein
MQGSLISKPLRKQQNHEVVDRCIQTLGRLTKDDTMVSNFAVTSWCHGLRCRRPTPKKAPDFSLIGIYEVILANICERSEFDVHLFRKLLSVCERIELGGLRYYFGFGAVFGDIPSAGPAMLLRASKDHKHGGALRGHCPGSALSHGAKRNKGHLPPVTAYPDTAK